jgi:periplasmic copper chaperone A
MRNHVTALLLVVFAFQIKPTTAGHHEEHSLSVGSVWARATPGQTTNGSVYLTIKNNSRHSDELIKAHSNLAARTMLHTHIMDKGVAQMRHVNSIPIPKKSIVQLKPGAGHIMLMGLKKPLKTGDTISLLLTFKKVGPRNVTVSIGKVGAMSGMHHHGK